MAEHPNWKALSTVDFSWKQFVREGQSHVSNPSNAITNYYSPKPALTGEQAKQIYENVVGLEPRPRQNHESRHHASHNRSHGYELSGELTFYDTDVNKSRPRPTRPKSIGLGLQTDTELKRPRPRSIESNLDDLQLSISLPNTHTDFADNLLSGESEETRPLCKPKIVPDIPILNAVMKEAEHNKVDSISKYIKDGMDLNVVDKFGWTILMCAVCSGSVDVVKLLLKSGADAHIRDKSGHSCQSMAKRHGHTNIVEILNSSCQATNRHHNNNKKQLASVVAPTEHFYCNDCGRSFSETTKEKHMSSTVHLFNSRPRSLGTIYGIPESNRGYQLLLKRGWDKESGLGPDGTGHKFPCKTTLKRDRKGLGVKQPKPRVTHFEPREMAAVRHVHNVPSSKRLRSKSINREKLKERKLRNELS